MKFEHQIDINAGRPQEHWLDRQAVWFGLLCRAEDPCRFLPALERCQIVERHEHSLTRRLQFGATEVVDQVRLKPMQSVEFLSVATAQQVGGRLTIAIEDAANGSVSLCFSYETGHERSGEPLGEAITRMIEAAYRASDHDTVRVIVEIHEAMKGHTGYL